MIKAYSDKSLRLAIPGLLLQIIGNVMRQNPGSHGLATLVTVVGTVLFITGLAYYAMAKGRSPAWCLLGFLSLIGLVVLVLLPDLAKDGVGPSGPVTPV